MKTFRLHLFGAVLLPLLLLVSVSPAASQNKIEVLTGAALTKVVPTSFYFAGQSAGTQMRNTAAARVGENRFVVAGLVDTSGYSTEISGKYEGFLITDSEVKIGDQTLPGGAYGFGFAADGKLNIFDLGSRPVISVATVADAQMKRPRPLQMTAEAGGVRFYKGKNYVIISPK